MSAQVSPSESIQPYLPTGLVENPVTPDNNQDTKVVHFHLKNYFGKQKKSKTGNHRYPHHQ